jgi:hypothetical protein
MNYARLVAAAVAATIFDAIYGFVVYGQALAGIFGRYPGVYRPADDMSHMPVLVAAIFVGTLAAAYIYAKGYEGGSGVAEGVRFGAAVGIFVGVYFGGVSWAVLNIGRDLGPVLIIVGVIEWFFVGVIIGLLYKPAAATK